MTICLLLRSSCGMAPFIPHAWLLVTLLWLLKLYLAGHNKRGNSHNGIQQPLLHTAAFLQVWLGLPSFSAAGRLSLRAITISCG